MNLTKGLLTVVGGTAAFVTSAALFCTRLIVRPGRVRVWSTPEREAGLAYEDITFEARDGTRLAGWFIAASVDPAPTIVILHGWPWNRMGTRADSPLSDLPLSQSVELMALFEGLHEAGYHVLTFDLRNFGDSERRGVVTAGQSECLDLLGALDYLEGRPDVDMERLGALGFSNGGSALLFALGQTDRLRAAIAVQPTTASVFLRGYTRAILGPFAVPVSALLKVFYRMAGGPSLDTIRPAEAAENAGDTPVLYIQGTGDRWGSQADVANMAAHTPNATAVYPVTQNRFEGYRYILNHPEVVLDFFEAHLSRSTSDSMNDGTPSPRRAEL